MSEEDTVTASVRAWFAAWGQCVAAVDFDGARTLFDPAVVGFGTFKDVVSGLDALESGQWRTIWPAIENFRFDLDSLRVLTTDDGLMAVGIVIWNSDGFDDSGKRFERPGRATVVLQRSSGNAPWRGMHTHFSLFPAERQSTFGGRRQ